MSESRKTPEHCFHAKKLSAKKNKKYGDHCETTSVCCWCGATLIELSAHKRTTKPHGLKVNWGSAVTESVTLESKGAESPCVERVA